MNLRFGEHVELFDRFLTRRQDVVERIEQLLLNVQGKETSRRRDRPYFENLLNSCFFGLPGLPPALARLRGQLAARRLADGFEPVALDQYAHELDPLELVLRAYYVWDLRRWPGRSARLTYAHTIFSVSMLRQLEGLSLTMWDDGAEQAQTNLEEIQRLLDRLNAPESPDLFVRDARWLVQTAQGPLTRHLEPYLAVADRVAGSLTTDVRLGLHEAGAKLAGGHLRSQLYYRSLEHGLPIDDPDILAVTRNSNSMDGALLIRDLVPMLDAYDTACAAGDGQRRLALADAILQGLSADPELSLTRLDLLGPLTTIEHLFVAQDGGSEVRHTTMGRAHAALVGRYGELIGRLSASLADDAPTFDPARAIYSPFGIIYGFVADVLSNMAQCRLVGEPPTSLSLEDTFISGERQDDKLARAASWRRLPTKEGEREHFEHSPQWASRMFARLTDALDTRARHPDDLNASTTRSARLFVLTGSRSAEAVLPLDAVAAQDYCSTSDPAWASASGSTPSARSQFVTDRNEGRFLASADIGGHWCGVSKVLLTVLTSHGHDAVIRDLPPAVVNILRLTCAPFVDTC